MFSSFVSSVKTEYNFINIWPSKRSSEDPTLRTAPPSRLSEALAQKDRARPLSQTLASTRCHNLRISTRTVIIDDEVTLQGWPSRGVLIELQGALAPDFEYLRLNPIDPPLRQDPDQEAEDELPRPASLGSNMVVQRQAPKLHPPARETM